MEISRSIGNNLLNITYPSQLDTIITKIDTIFSSIIISYPSTIDVDINIINFTDNATFGNASINNDNYIVNLNTNNQTLSENFFVNDESETINFGVLLHELLHILGVGLSDYWTNNINTDVYGYTGVNGIQQYKNLLLLNGFSNDIVNSLIYIPIENNFGSNTQGSHIEEGIEQDIDGNLNLEYRIIDNIEYPIVVNEIMSGFLNNYNYLTCITLGILEDCMYTVNYNSPYII